MSECKVESYLWLNELLITTIFIYKCLAAVSHASISLVYPTSINLSTVPSTQQPFFSPNIHIQPHKNDSQRPARVFGPPGTFSQAPAVEGAGNFFVKGRGVMCLGAEQLHGVFLPRGRCGKEVHVGRAAGNPGNPASCCPQLQCACALGLGRTRPFQRLP